MEKKNYTRETCISLLKNKYVEIAAAGECRYPKRSDFTDEEVSYIKAFLGPFPRALEAAEIKPCRDDGHAEKALSKRIRAKRRKTAYKLSRRDQSLPVDEKISRSDG